MTIYRSFIGGKWIDASSGKTLPNVNPADTNDIIGEAQICTREDTRRAIEAAYAAFKEWRNTPAPVRGRVLTLAARLMEQHKEELAQMLTREEGKIIAEARGEVQRATNVVEFCAGETRRMNGEYIPSELRDNYAYTIKEPHGVVGLITPWNFPIAIPAWKIAPALAAGNTVVFKPASNTPACAVRLVELFVEAGVPDGVLNLIIGSGGEVGDEIVNHPAVRAVSFTGSSEIGFKMYQEVAKRGIPFQAEMGGKNPVVIMPDCDLDLAVEHTAAGAFGSTGQRCTATSRAIVVGSIAEPFIEKIVERAKAYRLGPGVDEASEIGPSVDEAQFNTVLKYIDIGREDGATLLCGGKKAEGDGLENGYFVEPTVFDNVTPDMRIAREEIFGPVLGIMRVDSFEEAMAVANDCEYGLSSSIFSNDYNTITQFINEIESGMTHVNSPTTGGEAHIPFGGIKATGIGPREQGSTALDFYTELKVVYVDHTGRKREGNLY
ncbi:aldehyde dehydrogenase family protein [Leptolyngbya sp. 7M]|uniref:aldehyde dehydrogenase family protein n=1 Tax=Leptolyngbya sp. 7M TaxID=2812896 RepID=UPI001B8AEE58|nr:aldehyde dehydrogenase family protein [Leptolyngbya sp. 7M]QYO62073.1 aldehyde dehydrogenase family protein [Leptolyngbya sp. 7M]